MAAVISTVRDRGSDQSYEIDLPFEVEDRLLYYFSDTPFRDDSPAVPLNFPNDIFSIDRVKKVSRRCDFSCH